MARPKNMTDEVIDESTDSTEADAPEVEKKLLYNKGQRKIIHATGEILPGKTVRLNADAADYLQKLLPGELIDPTDAAAVFDQTGDEQ